MGLHKPSQGVPSVQAARAYRTLRSASVTSNAAWTARVSALTAVSTRMRPSHSKADAGRAHPARSRSPGCARNRFAHAAPIVVERRQRRPRWDGRAGRGTKGKKRNGRAPLHVDQQHVAPAPLPKVIPEKGPAATQDKRAIRRQRRARGPALETDEPFASCRRSATPPPPCPTRAWPSNRRPTALPRATALPRRPAARPCPPARVVDREPEHVGRRGGQGRIGTVAAGRGPSPDGERVDRRPFDSRSPLPPSSECAVKDQPTARLPVVVAVVRAELLGGKGVDEGRHDREVGHVPHIAVERSGHGPATEGGVAPSTAAASARGLADPGTPP